MRPPNKGLSWSALAGRGKRWPAPVALGAALLACAALAGQQARSFSPPAQYDTGTVIRTDVRVVVLQTTVVDKSGHLVTNLPEKSFAVYENNVQQQIRSFKREDVPISLGLIVDNSGSMRDKRAKVEAADLALVTDSNPDDEVFIVNFNDEPFLDLPAGKNFTSDIKEMKDALTRVDSRGGTALFDSIRVSIAHVKDKGHKDKRVLVVVTDGNDNSSAITLENLVRAAQQSEVLIYAVGLLSEEERSEAKKAEKALTALAVATGGEAFFPKDVEEVDRIAHQVARDIRSQYTIQYTPSNAVMDGSYRQIRVAVNAPGRPTARTRSGYYATPERAAPATPVNSSSFKQ
jgi:Ca-activated chloride channel homolog